MELVGLLKYLIVAFNFVIIYYLSKVKKMENEKNKSKNLQKTLLLITAHPDDESMFFVPTIINL